MTKGKGRKILDALNDAVAGNLAMVHIDGETWVRKDKESTDGQLVAARQAWRRSEVC
jgi:hypothetical protein